MSTGLLGAFNLDDVATRLKPAADSASGRRAEILVKTDQLRVVLTTMRAGAELQEHSAPGPITIQPLSGAFVVRIEDTERPAAPGDLIAIDTGIRHTVRSTADGAFLLTIVNPDRSAAQE